jgi:hypothetical protein
MTLKRTPMSTELVRKTYNGPTSFAADVAKESGRPELFEWLSDNRLEATLLQTALILAPSFNVQFQDSTDNPIPSDGNLNALLGSTRWHVKFAPLDWEAFVHLAGGVFAIVRIIWGDYYAGVDATIAIVSLGRVASHMVSRLSPGDLNLYLIVAGLSKNITMVASLDEVVKAAHRLEGGNVREQVAEALSRMVRDGRMEEHAGVYQCV